MRSVIIYILIFVCSSCIAQTTREQVIAFENDVKAYGDAISKIVKQNDCDGGIADLTALINRCEKEKGYSLTMLSSFYKGRGHGYLKKKDYSQSVSDYKNAISLLQKAGDEGKSDLSDTWYQLSLAYYYWGKPAETMNAANKCVESSESYFGSNHSNTLDAYSLRSNYEGFYDKGREAMQDRKKCFEIIQSNVERNFTYLTATERTAYWEKYLPETTVMFAFAQKLNEQQSEFTDALFDQQLLSKGLLLTAESALQRAIDGNPELSSAYQRIRNLRKKASNSETNPKVAEAATLEADRVERDLGTAANSLHQFMGFLKVHSGDVKSKLSAEDVAIEFVDYRIGKDSIMYAALVMTPKWNHVRFIPLIEKKEVEEYKDNLADYIWKPILDVLGYMPKNIYFAPSGLLYQIPIESQELSDGRYMCDAFNMYRMSSTRWLALEQEYVMGKYAAIYGGLQYDMAINDLVANANHYHLLSRSVPVDDEIIDRGVISSLKFLPGTLTEATKISESIKSANISNLSPLLYVGQDGTETSFKSLGGKQIRIVHIATHGFYSPKSHNSMFGSRLCFAGANNKYKGVTIPAGTDDGILTAQEISEIDLRGLDLAVLSACQSGLGHISADGVQGLQRGFKKAGCNSIIMSLWSVDDEATQILMTTFYKDYLSGSPKLMAFENAKRTLRSQQSYKDAKYWAAFVLLDGLNNYDE